MGLDLYFLRHVHGMAFLSMICAVGDLRAAFPSALGGRGAESELEQPSMAVS